MAEEHDPMQDETVRIAAEVHHRRESTEIRLVRKLIAARYEARLEDLVQTDPWSQSPPGALLNLQGQASALKDLLELIDEGPIQARAAADQAETPPEEQ